MSLNFPNDETEGDATASPNQPALPLGYWVRLTGQLDRLQATLDDVLATSEAGRAQSEALLRHLTDPARERAQDERLAELIADQEAGRAEWQAFADRLAGSVDELAQALARANRTQFKSNTLAEMKEQQVATALGVLQEIATRREQMQAARQAQEEERAAALRDEAQAEFAAELLPALDGLELALASGRAMLDRQRAAAAAGRPAEPTQPTFWQRLVWAFKGAGPPPGMAAAGATTPALNVEVVTALEAWLQGLEMVRTRFLGLLAAADIAPIPAEGQRFDPRLHLAMAIETRADAPDGAVVAVLRKGYQQRGRVLRYAEVTVNRAPAAAAQSAHDAAERAPQPTQPEDRLQQAMDTESEVQ